MDMKFGTCNIRSIRRSDSMQPATIKLVVYKLNCMGRSDLRVTLNSGRTSSYLGMEMRIINQRQEFWLQLC
jgi:hypothetical protein